MTDSEIRARIEKLIETAAESGDIWAVRGEDRQLSAGYELEHSKDNSDREDDRDYPEFGSPEYDNLPTLRGTSAWDPNVAININPTSCNWHHAYIVVGDCTVGHPCPDQGELLLVNARVVEQLF